MRRAIAPLSWTVLVVTACLCAQDVDQQIRQRYEKAQKATVVGRYAEAEHEYLAILKLNPSLAEAYANLGLVYYLGFKYAHGAEAFKKALKLQPGLARARLYLGLSEFSLGDYRNSIRSLEGALAGDLEPPYRKLARINLARDYLAVGQTDQAIVVLKELAVEYPGDGDILYTLGKAYLRLSAAAAARLGSAGDTPRVHQMLAENFVNQGKFKEAIDEYRAALSADPKLPGVDYPLGLLLLHEGRGDEGKQHLAAALAANPEDRRVAGLLEKARAGSLTGSAIGEALLEPPPGSAGVAAGFADPLPPVPAGDLSGSDARPLEKGALLYRQGQYEAAASLFRKAGEEQPEDPDALYWLVKSYQALSVRAFDQIARHAPDSARAHQLLAEGFEKQERFEQAVAEYQQALGRDPRLPGIHYALGLVRIRLGQWEEARKEFESELKVDPFNAGANYRLGQLAYRATSYRDAFGYFSRAIEIFPEFGEARVELGQALIREGRHKDAIPHLLAAMKLMPEDHTVHFQLYRAYRALGEKDLARRELEAFQRMEREKKEATLRKAAASMEQIRKTGKQKLQPASSGSAPP